MSISSIAAPGKSETPNRRPQRFAAAGLIAMVAVALLYPWAGRDAGLVKASVEGGSSQTLPGPAPLIVKTFKVSGAAVADGAEASSPLSEDDPRWGTAKATASIGLAGKADPAVDLIRFAGLSPGATAGANEGPDLVTGSISADPGSPEPGAQRQHVVIDIEVIAAAAKGFSMLDPAPEKTSAARIKSDVRLRARGSNSAKVVGVIPGGERVGVVGCRAWCEVTYKGKRGWVYSGFVKGHEHERVRRKVAARAPAAKETQSASAESSQWVAPAGSWVRRLFGGGEASEKTEAMDEKP